MTEQLAIVDVETTCRNCDQPWTPDVGDVPVCPECWPSDDRSEARFRDELGPVQPWEVAVPS